MARKTMKFITVLTAFTFVLAACDSDTDNVNNNNNSNNDDNQTVNRTTLTVTNLNFIGYAEAEYGSVNFGLIGLMGSGGVTKDVTVGTHYLYLTSHVFSSTEHREGLDLDKHNLSCNCPVFRTASITAEEGVSNQFNITRNTVVTFIGGHGYDGSVEITGTLQDVSDNTTDNYHEYLRGTGTWE